LTTCLLFDRSNAISNLLLVHGLSVRPPVGDLAFEESDLILEPLRDLATAERELTPTVIEVERASRELRCDLAAGSEDTNARTNKQRTV
jgi:hypothetical protein